MKSISLTIIKDLILEDDWNKIEEIIRGEEPLPMNIIKGLWHYIPAYSCWDEAFNALHEVYPVIERFYYMDVTRKGTRIGIASKPIGDKNLLEQLLLSDKDDTTEPEDELGDIYE